MPASPEAPKKILLIRIDRIGDMFTATPAIRAFRLAFPQARIHMAAAPGNAAVVRDNPHLDRVVVFPAKAPWKWPLPLLKLWAARYDWVVDLNGGSSTGCLLGRATGAKVRAGLRHSKTEQAFTVLHNPAATDHMIIRQLDLAARLGAASRDTAMVFPVSDRVQGMMAERFPRREGVQRFAVFIGNAKKLHTRWPRGKFVELCRRLLERPGREIHIIAGPGDEPLLEGFEWSERLIRFPGGNLEETGAFLKTCDLFVTSSSGPMHLAAALDVPMTAILARYTMDCWRPLAPCHVLIDSGHEGVDVRMVEVDRVLEAVEDLSQRLGLSA